MRHKNSEVQSLRTRLPTNSNILYTPEPRKNTIVFVILFNIQLFKHNFPPTTPFQECSVLLSGTFKMPVYTYINEIMFLNKYSEYIIDIMSPFNISIPVCTHSKQGQIDSTGVSGRLVL